MSFRRRLTKILTFLGGIYFFLEFVLPAEFLGIKISAHHEEISNGFVAVAIMAVGLGIINILMVHGSKIVFRRGGYGNSIALLIGLLAMLSVTLLDWGASRKVSKDVERFFMLRDFAQRIASDHEKQVTTPLTPWQRNLKLKEAVTPLLKEAHLSESKWELSEEDRRYRDNIVSEIKVKITNTESLVNRLVASAESQFLPEANLTFAAALNEVATSRFELLTLDTKRSLIKQSYDFLYTGLFLSLGAAMFSLLGFYIASAAYRAFRVRSGESALMMAAAIVVMLGQIPFGLYISESLPDIRLWLLSVPSAAAFRAIKFGAGVAGLVMAYRMWLSIESDKFAEDKKG